eukprot:TRINITY_DN2247_c0_g1_i2.p1 TRINITY_DN2247_c0_g1~~TRINITY_DN2247_c0_g1_i2.p1  ORF type:complete len:467 (-),score=118.16 TRINITY_DN2247_c0_g1_i2:158-1558(-)
MNGTKRISQHSRMSSKTSGTRSASSRRTFKGRSISWKTGRIKRTPRSPGWSRLRSKRRDGLLVTLLRSKKTSGEFGSDTESSAVYQYDEDSGDDDREINVGDTEDQTYDGSEIDRREAKNKKAQARAKGKIAGNTKKNTPLNVNKKANAQTPKSAANAAAAAAAATPGRPRERKNRRTSNQTDDMYLEPEEDEDFGGKYGKSTFWTDMEPYFAAFTDFDLRFCAPVNVDADECIVSIPPLGKHYRDVWAEEDSEELERIKSVVVEPPIGIAAENEPGEKPVACGDLTSRILSALIEEDIVPSNTYIQNQTVHTKENGSSHLEDSRFLSNLSPFKEYYGSGDSNGSGLPIETPPTYDYSFAGVHSLEERIKMELRSIGLLDDDGQYNSQREDDEICSEIRKLQKQLRDRTIATNVLRSKLQPQVAAAITKEEHDKKERINNANLEKQYLKLMRKKKATRSTKPKEIT